MPDTVGNPVEVVLGATSTCGPSTSDPSGHVTVGFVYGPAYQMTPYSPSGTPLGPPMQSLYATGDDVDRWFHWTANGYRGILRPPSYTAPRQLQTWDASGNPLGTVGRGVVTITPDGHGGTVAVAQDPNSSPSDPRPPPVLEWVDAGRTITRSVSLDNNVDAVVVNWSTGHVFALLYGSSRPAQGRWYDGDGHPLTAWFAINGPLGTGQRWHFLMDGTLVLAPTSGDWASATRDGLEGTVDVPDWLKARPNSRLATIRNGRGYAVIWNGVTDRFEIVSTSGKSCGTVSLPSVEMPTGTAPPHLDVGQDGTVIHGAGPAGAPNAVNAACWFRWWPALLR